MGGKKNLATKKIVAMALLKWRGKKNCGNGIPEIEGKKNCGNGIAEIEGEKNVVAPKIGGVNQLISSPLHLILIPKYLEYIH